MENLIKNIMLLPCCEDTKIDDEHILFNIYSSDFHGNLLVSDYKEVNLAERITQRRMQNSSASKFIPAMNLCAFSPCTDFSRCGCLGLLEL